MDSAIKDKVTRVAAAELSLGPGLSVSPQLIRHDQFGPVSLWILDAPGFYPRRWTCIVSTSLGDCYCSSRDLESFERLVLEPDVELQSIDNFEEWFTFAAPRKYVLMTAKRYPELFGPDEEFHDPAVVAATFEFYCQDLEALTFGDRNERQKFYRFRVDQEKLLVEDVEWSAD